MTWIAAAASVLALGPAGLRWLRVAQREHYIAGSCTRFAVRWWTIRAANVALAVTALAGVLLSEWWPLTAIATAVVTVLGPLGLSVRGRTSPLVVTRRLRTLTVVWLAFQGVLLVIGIVARTPVATAAGALVVPLWVDAALLLTAPLEGWVAGRFARMASARLRAVGPTVVAVTGSYGKTSTKNHIAHLVGGARTVVATPASFNNRAGLARAINENLVPGTEVFVAEMGTYGPGEIAELCRWCPPDISVITAIGPVHLERFGSEERIVEAKAEILDDACTVVLNVDDGRLAALAARLESSVAAGAVPARASSPSSSASAASGTEPGSELGRLGRPPKVMRAGTGAVPADVKVRRDGDRIEVDIGGEQVARIAVAPGIRPTNLACAVAVALGLGVPRDAIASRLVTIPVVANRLAVGTGSSGVVVLDDTYNSNPAGARTALEALDRLPEVRRRAVITPGMVELGARQADENERFAFAASQVATDLVVVGRTNRRALVGGWTAGAGPGAVHLAETRDQAVEWVRRNLGPGDAVLYENDLPDHYP